MSMRHTAPPVIMACLGLVALCASAARAQSIYTNDFQTDTHGFNTTAITTEYTNPSGTEDSLYLGEFSADSAILTLTGLTPGKTYGVAFDLYLGLSWDGNNAQYGPDGWSLKTGNATLIDTTFSNLEEPDFLQNYAGTNPLGTGSYTAFTGAAFKGDLPNQFSVYYFGHGADPFTPTFVAAGTTETLTFAGAASLSSLNDEYWALDNVTVTGIDVVQTPEPGASAFFACLLLSVERLRRRRRRR